MSDDAGPRVIYLYFVGAGEYSDWEVCGIYSTRKLADRAAVLYRGEVYECELDAMPDAPIGMERFKVTMSANGDSDGARGIAAGDTPSYAEGGYNPVMGGYPVRRTTGAMHFYVWARDADHAVRAANERRIALLAARQWIGPGFTWQEWRALPFVAANTSEEG